jgi:hypothetical protein
MFGQNLCIAVMCTLVKFCGQFVYTFARIGIPSNRGLKEQIKEKQTYHHLQLNSSLIFIKPLLNSPKTLW